MEITFLGTGTSQGVPVIGCDCEVCLSTNPKDKRLRSSVLINVDGNTLVIDTGPDFRQQMLRENVKKLDAVLFTHSHKDHTAGLDDIRSYNFRSKNQWKFFVLMMFYLLSKWSFHIFLLILNTQVYQRLI